MEGQKQVGNGDSSSFTSELFGSNDLSSSSQIFSGVFAPGLSKVVGREFMRSEMNQKELDSTTDAWQPKTEDGRSKAKDIAMSWLCPNQRVLRPCHLSSSLYYGGQDDYSQPQNVHRSGFNTTLKKNVVQDDSGSASGGNWWQGSLYY